MTGEPSEPVSLYIHVPFCTKKCDYCHFFVLPHKTSYVEAFTKALHQEWELHKPLLTNKTLVSIYFGGGTPYLWGPSPLHHFLNKVFEEIPRIAKDIEVTLEANPEHITRDIVQAYSNAGINRFSMGVQSFDDDLLHTLSRSHTATQAIHAIHEVKEAGITSLSIDLMYDLPHQTVASWEKTVLCAADLPIDHLSLYNLTFEPHTVFFKKRKNLLPIRPSGEESLQMLQNAINRFSQPPWRQYEISAFAKPGHTSCHNTGYWTGRPFIGLGPSAFSYWEGERWQNVPHLRKYGSLVEEKKKPIHFSEKLPDEAARRELFVIALRLIDGISLPQFVSRHGELDSKTHESLSYLQQKGWIEKQGEQLSLTDEGRLFYDSLASLLI